MEWTADSIVPYRTRHKTGLQRLTDRVQPICIMRTVEENYEGVVIGGRGITNLRYADDTTLLASTQERIKNKFKDLVQESARYNSTSALLIPGTQSRPRVVRLVPISSSPHTSAQQNLQVHMPIGTLAEGLHTYIQHTL